jgi:hypothetical protein
VNDDLNTVVAYRRDEAIRTGRPPADDEAWTRVVAQRELDRESYEPGYLRRTAAGIKRRRAEAKIGLRITGWREVRGSHSVDWVPDPMGTANPPSGYVLPEASSRQKSPERPGRVPA